MSVAPAPDQSVVGKLKSVSIKRWVKWKSLFKELRCIVSSLMCEELQAGEQCSTHSKGISNLDRAVTKLR